MKYCAMKILVMAIFHLEGNYLATLEGNYLATLEGNYLATLHLLTIDLCTLKL